MQTMVIISNLTFSLAYPSIPMVWFVNEPKRSHKTNSQICGANKKNLRLSKSKINSTMYFDI